MADNPARRRFQRGYLREIPIVLLILLVALSLAIPRLPSIGRKIAIAAAVVPILGCLFYMIITPGWRPGDEARRRSAWRLTLFLGCAAVIIAGAGAFMLK
jgi:hypothetical protein